MTNYKKPSLSPANQQEVDASGTLLLVAVASLLLSIVKLGVYFFSGSLVVLSSALDSISDSVVSFANGRIHRVAISGADKEHPFGHGGVEVLGSLLQGTILIGFGLVTFAEAIQRLFIPRAASRFDVDHVLASLIVMVTAALAGQLFFFYISRVRQRLEQSGKRSMSLHADSEHYRGDAYMNLTTAIGLAVVWGTGNPVFDSIFGAVGSIFLFRSGWPVLKQAVREVLHAESDEKITAKIRAIIKNVDSKIISIHRLRVRTMGPATFVDFHMMLPHQMTLQEAHDIGEDVARQILREIPQAEVLYHLDPDTEPVDEHHWVENT